jgi:hypothetical protein
MSQRLSVTFSFVRLVWFVFSVSEMDTRLVFRVMGRSKSFEGIASCCKDGSELELDEFL